MKKKIQTVKTLNRLNRGFGFKLRLKFKFLKSLIFFYYFQILNFQKFKDRIRLKIKRLFQKYI